MTISNEAVEAAGLKFRKKPVVIEAVQWTGDMSAVITFVGHDLPTWGAPHDGALRIETLEGDHACQKGDWIIRGIKGELYPCKPDIFAATYEPAAPHMLPAPEGVSEAEKALHDLCSWLDQWDRRDNDTAKNIRTVLSALSSERERAERAEKSEAETWDRMLAERSARMAENSRNHALEVRAQVAEAKVKAAEEALRPFLALARAVTVDGSPDFVSWAQEAKDWTVAFSFAGHSISLGDLRALAALRWTQGEGE